MLSTVVDEPTRIVDALASHVGRVKSYMVDSLQTRSGEFFRFCSEDSRDAVCIETLGPAAAKPTIQGIDNVGGGSANEHINAQSNVHSLASYRHSLRFDTRHDEQRQHSSPQCPHQFHQQSSYFSNINFISSPESLTSSSPSSSSSSSIFSIVNNKMTSSGVSKNSSSNNSSSSSNSVNGRSISSGGDIDSGSNGDSNKSNNMNKTVDASNSNDSNDSNAGNTTNVCPNNNTNNNSSNTSSNTSKDKNQDNNTNSKQKKKEDPFIHSAAGLGAGMISAMILHPLDYLKTNMHMKGAVTASTPSAAAASSVAAGSASNVRKMAAKPSYTEVFKDTIRSKGVKGLYSGLSPNLMGNASAWGLYFLFYTKIKSEMLAAKQRRHAANGGDPSAKVQLEAPEHLFAGSLGGACALTMTNPIWVVKTRMIVALQHQEKNLSAGVKAKPVYRGALHGIHSLWKTEGLRGLYAGYSIGLIGTSHGALQFMAYEELKRLSWKFQGVEEGSKLPVLDNFVLAGLSKIFASTTTYPYQVVRSRMQDVVLGKKYTGAWDCIRQTYRVEGIYGFYRGLAANVFRVTPAACIVFVAYDQLSHGLKAVVALKDKTV